MPVSLAAEAARVGRWFGVDDPWERPRPAIGRADVLAALALETLGLVSLELVRSIGVLDDLTQPWWVQWIAVSTGAVLVLGRRRYPLVVASLAAAHMVVVGVSMPVVMGQMTLQAVYFVAILSGVAWARDRRWMLVVVGTILVVMFTWIGLQFAIGNAIQDFVDSEDAGERFGLIGQLPAAVLMTLVVNAFYFGGAIVVGQLMWRSARHRALLLDQSTTIAEQADELRTRAVTEERLRIARELHDVVAHHVSVIGIQAAAARRVMGRDTEATATALSGIEASSRDAVTSMRGLLGTLREVERPSAPTSRAPQPGFGEIDALVASATTGARRVSFDLVESEPGLAARVVAPLQHSVYRTVQEALTNVEKHSTAGRVSVVLRLESGARGHVELEVVDDGRPRVGAPSSGLGQLGIRERAASHRGAVEMGPRATGGYRVRVRYPWSTADPEATAPDRAQPMADATPGPA
ncbi:sensor histidine kinase [Phycicoccus sp. BSK3Z-2]|uniref:histidine kinase n=1 Tax=Phycicoccus avicenniae TaxID=2828860 RepID=A0A941HZM3_9MICO|nr:histidine kinase [Phycicoccus avicenniae]MBR7744248.1 sensor histidine kinase [Phycicoccus avicenniae]